MVVRARFFENMSHAPEWRGPLKRMILITRAALPANILTLPRCVAGQPREFYYFQVSAATTGRGPGPLRQECRDTARPLLPDAFVRSIMPLCPNGVVDASEAGLQRQTELGQRAAGLAALNSPNRRPPTPGGNLTCRFSQRPCGAVGGSEDSFNHRGR